MDIITIIAAEILVIVGALYWGALLSDRLPDFNKRFNRKPFNCRPCLTFHLTWVFSFIPAFIAGLWELLALGIMAAFIVFGVVKFIDSKKIIE